MLLESLIVATCVSERSGCGEATSAYYQSSKELQVMVKNAEKIGNRLIKGNEYIIYVATPLYAVASGQTASFRVVSNMMLNINVKQSSIGLQWNW